MTLSLSLATVLGFVAIYALLPRARGYPKIFGAALGAGALVAAGWYLTRDRVVSTEAFLFYAFSAIAVISGAMLVVQRNPVHAALSFAVVVLSTCGLFLLQAAPFLMAATIIVYAGAIVVTFLFVIMLAQQAGLSNADQRSREPLLASLAGFLLLGVLLYVLHLSYDTADLDSLLSRLRTAATKETEEIAQSLGNEKELFTNLERAVVRANGAQLWDAQGAALQAQWSAAKTPAERKRLLTEFANLGTRAKDRKGSLEPRGKTVERMSNFSVPPVASLTPRETVAPLGRALFTDYLIPVELAGTLLLVATIGAIAIAGRRTEGLR